MTDFVTHSLLKTFLRCPRAAMYKYEDRLVPRSVGKALRRGTWIHDLLDTLYSLGGFSPEVMDSVREVHAAHTSEFNKLMDDEKEKLGDLPREVWRLFLAYLWHYRKDLGWTVLASEIKLEGELPNGIMFQGKADLLVEDQWGPALIDHKTHRFIPELIQRVLDRQSIGYLWLARKNGYKVDRFFWNYIKTEAPSKIRFTKGSKNVEPRIVANQGATDWFTAMRSIRDQKGAEYLMREEIQEFLKPLKAQRYDPERGVQSSPFFIREGMDKNTEMVDRVLLELMHTAERFMEYPFEERDMVERMPDRSCNWCPFRNLCVAELIGGNTDNIRRQEFTEGDPFGYYESTLGISQL